MRHETFSVLDFLAGTNTWLKSSANCGGKIVFAKRKVGMSPKEIWPVCAYFSYTYQELANTAFRQSFSSMER